MRITHKDNADIRPGAGRPRKYPFDELTPGACLEIPNQSIDDYRRTSTALSNFKRRNNKEWITAVRFCDSITSVYRIS